MYVKWNVTKYHTLSWPYGHEALANGKKRVIGSSYREGVRPAKTSCGDEIPNENEFFDRLPDGVDPTKDVCRKCEAGIGTPKVDHVAERARQEAESKAWADKFLKKMHARNRKLFEDL